MGMIIRVAFNNQNWSGGCRNVRGDPRLFKCREGVVNTSYGVDANGDCVDSGCWERTLCTEYFWERQGGTGNFGQRAEGDVFFVYPDTDNSLVLWGKSEVDRVEGNRVYFRRFRPLESERWVRNLSARDVLGNNWGQGTYRYLNADQVNRLNDLIR